jgi:hypothetical protein
VGECDDGGEPREGLMRELEPGADLRGNWRGGRRRWRGRSRRRTWQTCCGRHVYLPLFALLSKLDDCCSVCCIQWCIVW